MNLQNLPYFANMPEGKKTWLSYSYRNTSKSSGTSHNVEQNKDSQGSQFTGCSSSIPNTTNPNPFGTGDLTISKANTFQELPVLTDITLTKFQNKRQEILNELLDTERIFVENLKTIIDLFLTPIRNGEILTRVEIASLFSNVEFLYDQVNLPLLNHLEELMKQQQFTSIGSIFLELGDLFKLYAVYCSNQPNIHSRVVQFKDEYPEFRILLKKAFRNPRCRKLDLEAFLISPLQRLCKYPMLLKVTFLVFLRDQTCNFVLFFLCFYRN